MKRIIVVSLFVIVTFGAVMFANPVEFKFSSGTIVEGALKARMENNVSALLTEINRAGNTGLSLFLASINMKPEAKDRLNALWKDSHFVCDKQKNISKCLNDCQGYQVRAIPITMKPVDDTYTQSLNRELTISLDKNGLITGVRLALDSLEDVSRIMNGSGGVDDTRIRREILKWIEDYCTYYYECNIQALSQLFSDDALIITGSVVTKRVKDGDMGVRMETTTKYTQQSKEQYLKRLNRLFKRIRRINVEFEHISVVMHPTKANFYGVTLHQDWLTDTYMDSGWLFMVWDFKDIGNPQIVVCAWQHDDVVAKDGVFTLVDFVP